ncbi:hypothetical protein J8J23_21650, partial [Mycobacterium tuberculosis]|nr:hypothetical protein [Mycobacterium tuberculosis]
VVERTVAPTAMTDAANLDLMRFFEIFILSLSPHTAKRTKRNRKVKRIIAKSLKNNLLRFAVIA